MYDAQLVARAAGPLMEIIRNIKPDQLNARTPCAEYDVRKLVNHLLFWGPSLEGAARKESVPPPAGAETDLDLTDGDWAATLEAHIDRIVAAWSEPGAWQGSTQMGGPMELPASMIGGMLVGELVVHGWDLARATGQRPVWDDDLVEYLHEETARHAEQGREMGVYGPEVTVPASASTLDRIVGLTGRDPNWTP
ncbi:MAG: TIGR03086 family protein [Pseudonocardiaceae bacterium]|nr:TIGR03086 family protein [Pseudonocardiaceae bacterium]